jgi:hypothetical protein
LQSYIRANFGIDSRKTLAQLIALDTDVPAASLPANVFRIPGSPNVGAGLVGVAGATAARIASSTGALVNAPTPSPSTLTRQCSDHMRL